MPKGESSKVLIGEPSSDVKDVGAALYKGQSVSATVYSGSSVLDAGSATGETVDVDRVLSPLARSEVGTIRCIGLNYKQHAAEGGMDIPSIPKARKTSKQSQPQSRAYSRFTNQRHEGGMRSNSSVMT